MRLGTEGLLCAVLLAGPAFCAGQSSWPAGPVQVDLVNSERLDQLLLGGTLYLSLQDALALALENNLDIEVQRYRVRKTEANLRRAKAGTGGLSFDPILQSSLGWGHTTTPNSISLLQGSNAVVNSARQFNFGISRSFLSGATAGLAFNNNNQFTNSWLNDFNPYTTSSLGLKVTQPLLRGFGVAFNSTGIRIAKNDVRLADLQFRSQVIDIITNVIGVYWDLVAFKEDVKLKEQALAVAGRLESDNRKQVEAGRLAPIEITRARAEVAARRQDLLVSRTNLLRQETVLKSMLSKTGVAAPELADARIVPADRIEVPDREKVAPVQDLFARALENRPELEQAGLQVESSMLNAKSARNALLPQMDAFVNLTNNALAGSVDTPAAAISADTSLLSQFRAMGGPNPAFVGGYGTVLGQLFGRKFPDYSAGVQISIPLRNRAAQAEYAAAQLDVRLGELQRQQVINQIRVDVQNALIAMQQSHERYQAAIENRRLAEQTLIAEQKKFAAGRSTSFQVILVQRDVVSAQTAQIQTLADYARARAALDRATGDILTVNHIRIDQAMRGTVSGR